MKKLLLPLILVLMLASCSKDELIFEKVRVEQQGELLILSGWIPKPLTYDFSYSVKVKFCKDKDGKDQFVDFLVAIPAGQTFAFRHYVTDQTVQCKFISYQIQWQTHLIQ